jgi:virulence-associated protein VapD
MKVSIQFQATGTQQTVQQTQKLREALEAAAQANGLFVDAQGRLRDAQGRYAAITDELLKKLGITREEYEKLAQTAKATGEAVKASGDNINRGNRNSSPGVAELAFQFNNVIQAVQNLAAAAKPAYDLLIGQNEQLNQQLLGARANLVAVNKVLADGVEIKDPLQAIKALDPAVQKAVQQVRTASLDVVGVTSQQLIQVFNILTSQAANLTNQSKEIPSSIDAAAKLTTDFAAALGTIGLPLYQARQEINSILRGQITINSVLAKQLGITNEQVREWKAQGILVDQLRERLKPFVEGNKLAARSISGISSNIQEVLEVVAQKAGQPLLEPLVNSLDSLYQFLRQNQAELEQFSQDAVLKFLDLAQAVGDAAMRIGEALLPAIEKLAPAAETVGDLLLTGFKATATTIAGIIELLSPLINQLAQIVVDAAQTIELAQTTVGLLSGAYNDATTAAETYSNITAQLSEEALVNNQKLRAALELRNQAEKEGTQLTQEQIETEKQARLSNQDLIKQIKTHRTELVQASLVGTENKENVKAQIVELERQIKTLEKLDSQFKNSITNIQVQAKDLQELGDTYKQLANEAENAKRVLAEGASGDTELANRSAKELIGLTEKRRQLGQISAAEAIKDLKSVKNNTKIAFEQQVAATEAITKIKQREADQQVADLKFQQQKIQNEIETGQIRQVDGEKQITALKQQELEKRLQATREALARERQEGRGNGDTAQQLVEKERQQQLELLKVRVQGLKAAAKVRQEDGEQEIADLKFQQQKLQAEIEAGQVPQIEGERKLTALKQQEIEKRLQLTREALARERQEGRGNGDIAQQLVEKERQQQVELLKVRTEGQKKQQAVYLKDLEVSLGKAADAIKLSETERLIEIQKSVNKEGLLKQQADQQRLNAKKESINAELKLEAEKLQKLLALPKAANPEDEEARQAKIRVSRSRTASLTLELLQNEQAQQENLRAIAIKAIEDRAAAQSRASAQITADLEKEKAGFEAIQKSIDISTKLLESRANLQKSLANLQQIQSQGELDSLAKALEIRKAIDSTQSLEARLILEKALNDLNIDAATTELDLVYQRQAVEDKIAEQKRAAALADQERAKQSLALKLQEAELTAKQALTNAKIAENQAKQNVNANQAALDKALQNPQDQEAIKNAQQALELSKQQSQLAAENVKNAQAQLQLQPQLAESERKKLNADQKAELAQLDFADKSREASQSIELAQIEAAKFAESMKKANEAVNSGNGSSTPTAPTSRFTGGPMKAGQPYLVGDGPGGKFIPGVSEVIVPNTNSYAVSARKVAELMNPGSLGAAVPASAINGGLQHLTREVQGLRDDLKNRKPVSNNQFIFQQETDQMGKVYEVMDLIRLSMPL